MKTAKAFGTRTKAEWQKRNTLSSGQRVYLPRAACFGRGFAFAMQPPGMTPTQASHLAQSVFTFFLLHYSPINQQPNSEKRKSPEACSASGTCPIKPAYFFAANHSATALISSAFFNIPGGMPPLPFLMISEIPFASSLLPTLVRFGPAMPSRF